MAIDATLLAGDVYGHLRAMLTLIIKTILLLKWTRNKEKLAYQLPRATVQNHHRFIVALWFAKPATTPVPFSF